MESNMIKYQNPIIRGFNPDPSICRVGEDYYLVTSSNTYFPGMPLYHSRDLVNWTQINNCIRRPEQLPVAKAGHSGDVWAATIRYHEGTFYVVATMSGDGNFIVSAKDPAGDWSNPVYIPMEGIDPSLLFDDGKAYLCTNGFDASGRHGVTLVEINVETGELLGTPQCVWEGTGGGFEEAPHVYHIGDWYYAILAEGGTYYMHMVTAARSKNLFGPYEACPHNPIISSRHDDSWSMACSGHADFVEDVNGNWWMVHLATRNVCMWGSHVGRETFLMPFVWENGWPKVPGKGVSLLNAEGPLTAPQKLPESWEADFSERQLSWLNIRYPREESFIWGPEGLTLIPSKDKFSDSEGAPTFIAQRQYDMKSSVTVTIDFEPVCDGDETGLTTYQTSTFFYKICKRRENGVNYVIVQKQAEDFFQEVYRGEVEAGEITFRVDAVRDYFDFSYCVKGGESIPAGHCSTYFLSWDLARCFNGVVYGVYASCEEETSARALVTKFRMER